MIAIEYNGKKIECESEKEAISAMRKLKKEAQKEQAAKNALAKLADNDANESYRRLVDSACAILSGESSRYFKIHDLADSGDYKLLARIVKADSFASKSIVSCECRGGHAETTILGYNITGAIEDGSGFLLGLRLANDLESNWIAVGAAQDLVMLRSIPAQVGKLIEQAAQYKLQNA